MSISGLVFGLMVSASSLFGMALALYVAVKRSHNYWQRRGMPCIDSGFLGTFGEMVLKKKSFPDSVRDVYKEMLKKGEKFVGVYLFTRPQIMIADPDIIRDIAVTHFNHFRDRRPFSADGVDEMLGRSLLNLQGAEWTEMRHQLSPAFTSSKLRGMTRLIERTCRQLAHYLVTRKQPREPLDMNHAIRRFAADVICSTAFGTPCDSFKSEEETSEFYEKGIKLMDTSGLRSLVFAGYMLVPKLMIALKIPFVPNDLSTFFKGVITDTIQYREKENKSRPDMIQLLLDARNNDGKKIPDKDIISQAFTFFLGGFDTIATTSSFCVLLMAIHPDLQEKLRAEVDEVFESGQGSIPYEKIGDLKYMDMFMSEVMRMYPAAPMTERMCKIPFEMPEQKLCVEKDISVIIPIIGLHYNPDYFPEPEKFDPERFSEQNKDKIKPNTYLPFGLGPRNCIGMRFAQMETKMLLAYILATVELEVCERTQLPIKLSAENSQVKPIGGFYLRVTPRENPSYKVENLEKEAF